jgi:hypothetical protein
MDAELMPPSDSCQVPPVGVKDVASFSSTSMLSSALLALVVRSAPPANRRTLCQDNFAISPRSRSGER